jgi:hypothetical protein
MHTTPRLLVALTFLTVVGGAYAQTPTSPPSATSTPASPAPKVEKDCINLAPQAMQECLKVAKKMDRDATTAMAHDPATKPDSGNSPSPNTVQHSSAALDTPTEIKQEAKARKQGEAAAARAKAKQDSKPNPDPKPPATPQ